MAKLRVEIRIITTLQVDVSDFDGDYERARQAALDYVPAARFEGVTDILDYRHIDTERQVVSAVVTEGDDEQS